MKTALIIGASGFFGSHLLEELQKNQVEIFAVENNRPIAPASQITVLKGGIAAVTGKLIDEICPDAVFHCARPTIPKLRKTGRILASFYAQQLNQNLLKQVKKSVPQPLLVFASGSLMYGNSNLPQTEDSPINPVSYARQYYRGELPLLETLKNKSYPLQILRFPWLLGYGSWFYWFYLEFMKKQKAVPLFGDGTNLMDIIDIRDAARLAIQFVQNSKKQSVINICPEKSYTQIEFASALAGIFGLPLLDYKQVITGKLENETIEAFNSNIILTSKYREVYENYKYVDLHSSLQELKRKFDRDQGF